MIDVTLKGPENLRWKAIGDVLVSDPGLLICGYDMRLIYLPTNTSYEIKRGDHRAVILNLLRGSLKGCVLRPMEAVVIREKEEMTIESKEDDCLLFACFDLEEMGAVKEEIHGLSMRWVEPVSNVFRTDPKIEVDGFRLNLWYAPPNMNMGIHNHSHPTDHSIAEQMIEVHTQLRGSGWMVKYREKSEESEYDRFEMKYGKSHPLFCSISDGQVSYPWHAYQSGAEGTLFLVMEDVNCMKR